MRLIADASAQTTIPLALGSGAASFVGASTANFTNPAGVQANALARLTILDQGNPLWNPAAPFLTPFEYADYTTNTVGTNTISGMTRGVAGTTPKSFFANAIVAQGLLAEDLLASVPWKFDEQVLGGSVTSVRIPASGSFPASYLGVNFRHIQIIGIARGDAAALSTDLILQFNGDNAANYHWWQLFGNNNTASSSGAAGVSNPLIARIAAASVAAAVGSDFTIDVVHAFSSVWAKHAKCVNFSAEGSGAVNLWSIVRNVHWFTTNQPITSILLTAGSGNIVANSLFTTYLVP